MTAKGEFMQKKERYRQICAQKTGADIERVKYFDELSPVQQAEANTFYDDGRPIESHLYVMDTEGFIYFRDSLDRLDDWARLKEREEKR